MLAVIKTGGKQYKVAKGDVLEVELVAGEAGAKVEFNQVLAVGNGGDVKVGKTLSSAKVIAEGANRTEPAPARYQQVTSALWTDVAAYFAAESARGTMRVRVIAHPVRVCDDPATALRGARAATRQRGGFALADLGCFRVAAAAARCRVASASFPAAGVRCPKAGPPG